MTQRLMVSALYPVLITELFHASRPRSRLGKGWKLIARPQLIETIRPILPSVRNTPYGKRIQSKLAREDASFAHYGGGGGGGGGYGGRGGYRGGAGGGGGGGAAGGYQRHLGRPQLQHINALTEVYGAGGPFVPAHGAPGGPHGYMPHTAPGQHPHGSHMPQGPGGGGPGGPGGQGYRDMSTHTGVAYHAPGPDGQPWLHLRGPGPAGGPVPNWGMPPNGAGGPGVDGLGADSMGSNGLAGMNGMNGMSGMNGMNGMNGMSGIQSPNGRGGMSNGASSTDGGMPEGMLGNQGMWSNDGFMGYNRGVQQSTHAMM